jgi:poly-beta-1,6-N-acetyl-D-glucosamine synthase
MTINYAIITPAHNEELFIRFTLDSVVSQTIQPVKWVIVDDGSTDNTSAIIQCFAVKFPWITMVKIQGQGVRERGGNVIRVVAEGLKKLEEPHDFIVKLDADVSFHPEYFEKLFEKFYENPKLGIAGGVILVPDGNDWVKERIPADHVRGATKVYRKACYDEIDGIPVVNGWDSIDEWRAQMKGWKTQSFEDIVLYQHRTTGGVEGWYRGNKRLGEFAYYLNYIFPYIIARSLFRSTYERPLLLAGLAILYGYLESWFTRKPQFDDPELLRYIHQKQWNRLMFWRGGKSS